MASPQQTDLSYAWEKYMDCRLQGADLQVGAAEAGVIQTLWGEEMLNVHIQHTPGRSLKKVRLSKCYIHFPPCKDGDTVFVFITFQLQNCSCALCSI